MKGQNLILLSILSLQCVQAQTDCSNALLKGNQLLIAGKMQEAINILEPCLSDLKGRENRVAANRILSISYLELNNLEKLEIYSRKLLRAKPDYQKIPNTDPTNFSRYISKFQVSPRWSAGITSGFNINNIKLLKSYSALPSQQKYRTSYGYFIGVSGKYHITPVWALISRIQYSGTSINHRIENSDLWTKDYTESLQFTELNFTLTRDFNISSKAQLHLGPVIGSSVITKSLISVVTSGQGYIEQKTKNGLNSQRKINQPFAGMNLGLDISLPKGSLSFDYTYSHYFRTTVNPEHRLSDQDFIFSTGYINDDIKLRLFQYSLTYRIPVLFNISKSD